MRFSKQCNTQTSAKWWHPTAEDPREMSPATPCSMGPDSIDIAQEVIQLRQQMHQEQKSQVLEIKHCDQMFLCCGRLDPNSRI